MAEAGAEEEEQVLEPAHPSENDQDDWENEGGALDREAKKTGERG